MTTISTRGMRAATLLVATISIAFASAACSKGATTDATRSAAAQVDSLVLAVESVQIEVGDSTRIIAIATNSAGQPVAGVTITYTSSNTAVATVSAAGYVRAIGIGEADITVDVASGISLNIVGSGPSAPALAKRGASKFKMTVAPVITITPSPGSVDVGKTVQFTATARDHFRNPLPGVALAWSTGDQSIATVSSNGLATGVKAGATTITAAPVGVNSYYGAPASLTVNGTVCGGIMDVASWTMTLEASDTLFGNVGDVSWVLSQHTKVAATLGKKVSIGGANSGFTWSGVPTGESSANNRLQNGEGADTEFGQGALASLPTPSARVWISQDDELPGIEQSCSVHVEVIDAQSLDWRNAQGASGRVHSSVMAASTKRVLVSGNSPPPGGWALGGTDSDTPSVTEIFLSKEMPAGYWPVSPLGASILQTAASTQQGLGKAKIVWTLRTAP